MEGETPKAKISGYLEKKGKMKVVSSYKKYWFVLEGRLLLYYRSKDEYELLSPCKGQINLGPPCNVKPCPSTPGVFQIETRSSTVTFRAQNREDQHKWMQAIMAALNQTSSSKLSHFRYSLDDIPRTDGVEFRKTLLERQRTLPDRIPPEASASGNGFMQKLQKLKAQTYGSMDTINRISRMNGQARQKSLSNRSLYNDIYDVVDTVQDSSSRKSLMVENEAYLELNQKKMENLYEQIPGDIRDLKEEKDMRYMKEDHIYTMPKKTNSEVKSVLIENEQYLSANQVEQIYDEPKTDLNKNSLKETDYQIIEECKNEIALDGIYSNPLEREAKEDKKHKLTLRNITQKFRSNRSSKKLKKSGSFIDRVWKRTKKEKTKDEFIEQELSDALTIKVITELQHILEKKKPFVEKMCKDSDSEDCVEYAECSPEEDKTNNQIIKNIMVPVLPPKGVKLGNPCQDSQTIKTSPSVSLEDIDNTPSNVKDLIEKFNEFDVELRNNNKEKVLEKPRDSDELNYLLNELSKITSAPILTPGTTSSLINGNIADEELLKLVPIRKRRLSEPDYDVPRPHKSLISLPFPKTDDGSALPSTNFFGPVNLTQEDSKGCTTSGSILSITPDSLEPTLTSISSTSTNKTVKAQESAKESHSYNSHNYHLKDFKLCKVESKADKRSKMNNYKFEDLNENNKFQDVFEDSLEVGNELSTAF